MRDDRLTGAGSAGGAGSGRNAALVAAGILLSRLAGLVRQMLFAHAFGNSAAAGAFSSASRIPNILQNLLGEGVLSASFIPVYASLRARGEDEEADGVAGAVFGLLALTVAVVVALGIVGAPLLVSAIAPGFEGPSRALTISMVRILFPGTGVLVLSAWCLGILNSHRRFFLAYAAPVLWNGAIIVALLATAGQESERAILWVAWGTVAGGVAQFLVQVPRVMRLLGRFAPRPSLRLASVKQVMKGFFPAVAARGVVQISAYTDNAFTSLISERAVAALSNAQVLALLPVSLFGMSISAAELPEMAQDAAKGEGERTTSLRSRLGNGLERMAFFVVPSAVALLFLGDVIAGLLFQSGRFSVQDTRYAWYLLMGSGVGLLAQTSGRLVSSAFYALKDTRTPFRMALLRVTLGVSVGYYAVRILPDQLGLPDHLGAVFITLTTAATAWLELALLKRALARRIGPMPSALPRRVRLWSCAAIAGAAVLGLKVMLTAKYGPVAGASEEWGGGFLALPAVPEAWGHWLWFVPGGARGVAATKGVEAGLLVLFGATYLGLALAVGVPQAHAVVRRLIRVRGRKPE